MFRGRKLPGSVILHFSAPIYILISQMSPVPVVEEKTAVKQVFGCLFLRTARENSCFFGGLVWELKSGFSMTPTADVRWFILQVYNEHKCLKQLDQPAWEPKRGFFLVCFTFVH